MSDRLEARILGCGSSGGVPRLGNRWGDCDPTEPRNARSRCSLLLSRHGPGGITRVLIDTSPDLRAQMLGAEVGELDGVIWTHAHADHVHGIDDLRMIAFNMRSRLQCWADAPTTEALMTRFGYAFETPPGSDYPPICDLHPIGEEIAITGAGGEICLTPFDLVHGNISALGLRCEGLAYLPDVNEIPESAWRKLGGLDCMIVDALRRTPHPSHAHLALTLEWIARAAPKRAVLTNMHYDLDYATLAAETPEHVTPAHDGMTLSFDI